MSDLAYLTTEDDKHFLNVIVVGGYHKFEINKATLARLNVECAERLLLDTQGTFATRFNAKPLCSEGSIL